MRSRMPPRLGSAASFHVFGTCAERSLVSWSARAVPRTVAHAATSTSKLLGQPRPKDLRPTCEFIDSILHTPKGGGTFSTSSSLAAGQRTCTSDAKLGDLAGLVSRDAAHDHDVPMARRLAVGTLARVDHQEIAGLDVGGAALMSDGIEPL